MGLKIFTVSTESLKPQEPVVPAVVDEAYVASLEEFHIATDLMESFLEDGGKLASSLENLMQLDVVMQKRGITDSLIDLVGSEFGVSLEEDAPKEKKEAAAAAVKDGAAEAKTSLFKKIIQWFVDLYNRFVSWIKGFFASAEKSIAVLRAMGAPKADFKVGSETITVAGFGKAKNEMISKLQAAINKVKKLDDEVKAKTEVYKGSKKAATDEYLKQIKDEMNDEKQKLAAAVKESKAAAMEANAFIAAAKRGEKPAEPAAKEEPKK